MLRLHNEDFASRAAAAALQDDYHQESQMLRQDAGLARRLGHGKGKEPVYSGDRSQRKCNICFDDFITGTLGFRKSVHGKPKCEHDLEYSTVEVLLQDSPNNLQSDHQMWIQAEIQ
eukprot:gene29352-12438_t